MESNSVDFPRHFLELLRSARNVAVLTGAGISAESGVPTFRDAQTGLWEKFRPEELATPEAFQRNPKLVWEWYAWRRELVANVEPNAGHRALAQFERHFAQFTLITQNVDGLHQSAGSQNVVELHGNIGRTKCSLENQVVSEWPATVEVPPRCPACGGLLRPDVVWFGESLPGEAIDAATEAARNCDLFFSIGTSTVVYPAAALPELALKSGACVVEINPAPTPFTGKATFSFQRPAGEILPLMVRAIHR